MQQFIRHRSRTSRYSLLVTRCARSARGQVLVEALVAVSILVVGFLGIMTLLSRALSLNRVIADNYIATYLAAEGVEVAKNILDGNVIQGRGWNEGFASGAYEVDAADDPPILRSIPQCGSARPPLRYDEVTQRYSYRAGSLTAFRRCLTVSAGRSDEVTINSRVEWITRGGGNFEVDLEDHFYNWRP